MGKKKKKIQNEEIDSENDEEEQIDNKEIFDLSNLNILLSIINSNNNEKIDQLSQFLSSFNIDEIENENVYIILTSENFLINYINLLINPNINIDIKNNIVISLLNIFILGDDVKKSKCINYQILMKNSLINIFIFFYSEINSHIEQLENENFANLIFNLSDLFNLLIEILSKDENIKGKIQIFDNVIGLLLNLIINKNIQNKEFKNVFLNIIYNLISSFCIEINETNQLNKLKLIQIDDSNFICSLFYIYCSNKKFDLNIQKNIDLIYNNVNNTEQFISKVIKFKDTLNKYFNDESMEINTSIKEEIQNFYQIVNQFYIYIKTFNDIFENIEDKNLDTNNISDLVYSDIISLTVSSIFTKELINKSLNDTFLSNTILLFENLQLNRIDSYLLKDSNKLLKAKQNISQIEILSLNIIHNAISKFNIFNFLKINNHNKTNLFILQNYIINSLNNYQKYDDEYILLVILLLRNLINIKINLEIIIEKTDYKLLFTIMNKYINNNFLKCNILDIIAYIYSIPIEKLPLKLKEKYYTNNKEINSILNSLFYKESSCEVLSHTLNAFMDIYQWDDIKLNKILKDSQVLILIKNGIRQFKSRMNSELKSNIIDKEIYEEIELTLTNIKSFLKYKENI